MISTRVARLRVVLIVDRHRLQRWHLRCIELLEQHATVVGIVTTPNDQRGADGRSMSRSMRRFVATVENASLIVWPERFNQLPQLEADFTIDSVRLEFDMALQLGPGSIPASIASRCRHGAWFFAHEHDAVSPPFLGEVYHGRDVTHGALLARLGDGTTVALKEGWFRTDKRSYQENLQRVTATLAEWPANVSRWIFSDGGFRAPLTPTADAVASSRMHLSVLRWRLAWRFVQMAWDALFRHRQWNIGVIRTPIAALLRDGGYDDDRIEWFPLRGRREFLADPFGLVRNGVTHILCESYPYRSGVGVISALTYADDGFVGVRETAIQLPVHLSYPFLIEDGGQVYCVPESCGADEIALYRAEEFPLRWRKVGVLVEGFGGIDSTVFEYQDRWWLLCTAKGRDANVSLWIWHASDLAGPWLAHERNPVKCDVRSSRPGGLPFVHDGELYRPVQDCSRTYGWRIGIQRVTSLTPTTFAEEEVVVLSASPTSRYPLGRHTLTPVGDVVLIDGHRTVFVWAAFTALLRVVAEEWLAKLRPAPR